MTNLKGKLGHLHTIIFMVMSEKTSENPTFMVSGYQLCKEINSRGLNFSHQHVYRTLSAMTMLQFVHVPQNGKPDMKMYSFKDIKNRVELMALFFSLWLPQSLPVSTMLACNDLDVLVPYYNQRYQAIISTLSVDSLISQLAAETAWRELAYLHTHIFLLSEKANKPYLVDSLPVHHANA